VITVQTAVEDRRLRIIIRNSGPTRATQAVATRNRRGIGLANTSERLRRLYGSQSEFELRWPDGGGCETTIRLPFKKIVDSIEEIACAQ
jgi:LytS/YehU family sensor histidine kinase